MKFNIKILVALSVLMFGLLAEANCDKGVIRISGASNYPPLSWSEDGMLTGYTINMVEIIFKELGISADMDSGATWKRTLLRAEQGKLDLLVGVRKYKEAERFLLYIEPPLTPASQSVVMRDEDVESYKKWEDLKGLIGGMIAGDSFGEKFDAFMKSDLELELVDSHSQNISKLYHQRIDYVIGPTLPLLLESQNFSLKGMSPSKNNLVVLNEYLAFSKYSPCIKHVAYLSKRLAEMKKNGRLDEMFDEYFEIWFQNNQEKSTKLDGLP